LFAILAGRFVSVAAKGVRGADCWRESNWMGWEAIEGLEGLPGGRVPQMRPGCPANPTGMRRTQRKRTLRAGAQKSYPTKQTHYSILVQLVKYYFKWCVCWEIV